MARADSPSIPQLRGINTQLPAFKEGLLDLLTETKVNVIRINVKADKDAAPPTAENPLAPYKDSLDILNEVFPQLQERGIHLIVCASEIYGRKLDVMWKDESSGQEIRNRLADFWLAFAKRYKGHPAIIAYDVFNEPNYPKGQEYLWYDQMLPQAVAAIRSVNPEIWLVVEPGPWGLPGGFEMMKPLNDPYVIYSFHHYAPHSYTHQGIRSYPDFFGRTYPGTNRMFKTDTDSNWDKARLRESMKPAIDFARKYNVRMLVGEFSAIRWAPGAAKWIDDSVEIFEEEGWDWCYHSLGVWNGWSPTYPSGGSSKDKTLSATGADGGHRTDRWEVLQKYWSKNRAE